MSTPHNYRLEAEQPGRCITDGELPHVTEAFTMQNAHFMEKILHTIGY